MSNDVDRLPPSIVESLMQINQRAEDRMREMLLLRINLMQGNAVQGVVYDALEWYRKLVMQEGGNPMWFQRIGWDLDKFGMSGGTAATLNPDLDDDELLLNAVPGPVLW
jgi:hypothetical protein